MRSAQLPISIIAWGGALALLAITALTAESHSVWDVSPQQRSGASRITPEASQSRSNGSITIEIDADHPIGTIHPMIYGMAMPTPDHFRALRVGLARWGGNPNTRYNWERGNCWNAARDWRFANVNYVGSDPAKARPSGTADLFIQSAHAEGAACLLTIPTMGWVASDHNSRHASVNVPPSGGMPLKPGSEAIPGYDPTANRVLVSIRSLPRKGRPFSDPPDTGDDAVYQDEWTAHLVHTFGPSRPATYPKNSDRGNPTRSPIHNGVEYYAMDNEPDLWDYTHTDMHPVAPDYEELRNQFLSYADAIKTVDPTAQITGPVSSGWGAYFFSPRDRGADRYATHAERRAHGNRPFLPWFLAEVAKHDRQVGHRTLDVLDVHFYPQGDGIYSNKTDPTTNALRLRSTRALWDPTYRDESWIEAPVQLIPRLHRWIDENYPGTRLALTEWNWGAEKTINGGLAAAEVLGILGRERVDMACYWTAPAIGSPAFYAFKLYRNADDLGHGFGDIAIPARSEVPDYVSCYAAIDSSTGAETLMLINKSERRQQVKIVRKTADKPIQTKTIQTRIRTEQTAETGNAKRQKERTTEGKSEAERVVKRQSLLQNTFQLFRYDRAHLQNIVMLPDTSHITTSSTSDLYSESDPKLDRPLNLPPASMTLLRYTTQELPK